MTDTQKNGGDDIRQYENVRADARNMWLSGTLIYVNQISLEGSYKFITRLSADFRTVYTFILNAGHQSGRFAHDVDFALSLCYTLF